MIYVSTNSPDFPHTLAEQLYTENKKYFLPLDISFQELVESLQGNLWAVIADDQFIGIIYFEVIDDKWFLSGVSRRKMHKYIPKAIEGLCRLYFEQTDTIYSDTPFKHAQMALKRAGFKQIDTNIFRKDKT